MSNGNGNREYKSDVFSMLMKDKTYALSVYNVLNRTAYTDPDDVEMETLESGFSLSIRNDAAFVVDASLNIYEHQSSVCPNMPLRNLIYFSRIIKRRLKESKRNLFGSKLIKIPVPKFVVFYNGEIDRPEEYELRLSDAFEKQVDSPELELVCKVYNVNIGKHAKIIEECKVIKDYMTFVDYVRKYYEEQDKEDYNLAIEKAIDRCIEESVLVDFFRLNRAEVVKNMQLDYTFERQLEMEREDAREEGREEVAKNLLSIDIPIEEVAKCTKLTIERIKQLCE